MSLIEKIEQLGRLVSRLEQSGGRRIARRYARRAFAGMLRQVRNALDEQYPAIKKPVVKKWSIGPDPGISKAMRLPFRRAYDHETARLFANLAAHVLGLGSVVITGEWSTYRTSSPKTIWVTSHEKDPSEKWKWLIVGLANLAGADNYAMTIRADGQDRVLKQRVLDLWKKFWSEPIPVSDLPLAALHHEFLEKRGKK